MSTLDAAVLPASLLLFALSYEARRVATLHGLLGVRVLHLVYLLGVLQVFVTLLLGRAGAGLVYHLVGGGRLILLLESVNGRLGLLRTARSPLTHVIAWHDDA